MFPNKHFYIRKKRKSSGNTHFILVGDKRIYSINKLRRARARACVCACVWVAAHWFKWVGTTESIFIEVFGLWKRRWIYTARRAAISAVQSVAEHEIASPSLCSLISSAASAGLKHKYRSVGVIEREASFVCVCETFKRPRRGLQSHPPEWRTKKTSNALNNDGQSYTKQPYSLYLDNYSIFLKI